MLKSLSVSLSDAHHFSEFLGKMTCLGYMQSALGRISFSGCVFLARAVDYLSFLTIVLKCKCLDNWKLKLSYRKTIVWSTSGKHSAELIPQFGAPTNGSDYLAPHHVFLMS